MPVTSETLLPPHRLRPGGMTVEDIRRATRTVPGWVAVAVAGQAATLAGPFGPSQLFIGRDGRVRTLDAPGRPPIDAQASLDELAATLAFLLTGLARDSAPGDRLGADLAPPLAAWLARALARPPGAGFRTAEEMRVVLVAATSPPIPARKLAGWIKRLVAEAREPEVLTAGTRLGRYVVLDKLGQGGMGVVYTAYDPELDRKIALKLLRREVGRAGQARLLREAQAMAKIAHPNTVAIYDVGLIDGRVFLAIELVAGVTLADWLLARPRSWREIVTVMLEAGRGLAAAHDAGLAHRDVKPGNVLIGPGGRAKVTDFGLARRAVASDDASGEDEPARDVPRYPASDDSLTRVGAVIGTPAYMAPEQRRGQPPDVRTDQYSFAVTFYEALWGERPPVHDTVLDADVPPRRLEAPIGRRVPRWLTALLRRALSERPEDRYPTMNALLADLARDRSTWLRRALVIAASLALVVAVAASVAGGPRDEVRCAVRPDRLRGAWDEEIKGRVQAAFVATGAPFAVETFERTAATLDGYARDWIAMRGDACAATLVRGEQSEAVLVLRQTCLDRAEAQLGALTALLATADAGTVERAGQAASNLPRIRECANVELLTRHVNGPTTLADRAVLVRATDQVARVNALYETGRYAEGAAAASALDRDYGTTRPRITAENAYIEGQILFARGELDHAIAAFERAAVAAERGAYPLYVARAYGRLVFLWACPKRDPATADRYDQHAQAVLAAIGGDALGETWRLTGVACLRDLASDGAGATDAMTRALDVYTKAYGHDAVYATLLTTLGASLNRDPRRALAAIDDAIATQEALLGGHHPKLAFSLTLRGQQLTFLGRYAEAADTLRRAIAIRSQTVTGPDRLLASTYLTLARAELARGDADAGAELARLGHDMRVATAGGDASETIEADVLIAEAGLAQGDATAALQRLVADVSRLVAAAGATADINPGVIDARLVLGDAYRATGRPGQAREIIELALAGAERRADPRQAAMCRFALAQLRAVDPRDLPAARALAATAQRAFAALPNPARAAEVERWLAAHR